MPHQAAALASATSAATGLLACRPNKLPPGGVAANRLAVDSARPGRLNAFAVCAFCAEITRLPGQGAALANNAPSA